MADIGRLQALERASEAARMAIDIAGVGRSLAVGYATVDLDRAAREMAADLALPPAAFREAADSAILGAHCLLAEAALATGLSLILLEPSTEGRIAAFLARFGEAPAATWYAAVATDPHPVVSRDGRDGRRPGPLGIERLVAGDPSHGPFRIVVEDGRVPSTS